MPFRSGRAEPDTARTTTARFVVDFSPENDRELDTLARELGVRTRADVIRKAVGLLPYTVEQRKAGAQMVLENRCRGVRMEVVKR